MGGPTFPLIARNSGSGMFDSLLVDPSVVVMLVVDPMMSNKIKH